MASDLRCPECNRLATLHNGRPHHCEACGWSRGPDAPGPRGNSVAADEKCPKCGGPTVAWHGTGCGVIVCRETDGPACLIRQLAQSERDYQKTVDANYSLRRQLAAKEQENADLKAAIATPEVCAGIISKVVEQERDRLVDEVKKLREQVSRLMLNNASWESTCDRINGELADIRLRLQGALDSRLDGENGLAAATMADNERLRTERDGAKAVVEARLKTPIVCLCGSTRFIDEFDDAALELTLRGIIVLSVGSHKPRSRQYADGKDGHKANLDELHKRKIDLAHSVFVLNIDNYTGDSTEGEIAYAEATGKPVCYWTACSIVGDPASWDEIAKGCRAAAREAAGADDNNVNATARKLQNYSIPVPHIPAKGNPAERSIWTPPHQDEMKPGKGLKAGKDLTKPKAPDILAPAETSVEVRGSEVANQEQPHEDH